MPSTFTSRLGFELQATGENSGVWGSNLNSNAIDLIDTAIAGLTSVPLAGTDVTLTKQNGTTDQSRSAVLYLHGTLINDVAVVVPSVTKAYAVDNQTSGPFSVTVKTAGGTGAVVAQGTARTLYVSGTSVIPTSPATSTGSPTFGSAAYLNAGTSVNELPPVSVADARYARPAGANVFVSVNRFDKQVYSPIVTLAYAATVSIDFTQGNKFLVSLAGNSTFIPVGHQPGQAGIIYLVQDGVGSRTAAWSSQFKFPSSIAPTLTAAASAVDDIPYEVRSSVAIDAACLNDMR